MLNQLTDKEKEQIRLLKENAPYTWMCTSIVYELYAKYNEWSLASPSDDEIFTFFEGQLDK